MFNKLQGNARGCLIYEPMFIVPYSLYLTYASIYMLELGITETEIGLVTSLGLVLQIFTSLISGYLTDRMGRKRALLIYDLVSWSVATLLWMTAQNVWFFVIAAAFNSFQKVPNTAWYCLLVEGTHPKDRAYIFSTLQFISVASGLLAPLGGLLVERYTLISAERMMYGLAFVSMTAMFICRHFATYETEIGIRKMKEHASFQWKALLQEYISVLRAIVANKALLLVFGIYVLYQFQLTMRNTYLSIYLVQSLQFDAVWIAWLPAVTSVATLLLLFFYIPRLNRDRMNTYMLVGLFICTAAYIIQIVTPPGAVMPILFSTVFTAAGSIIVYPNLEAAVQNAIDDDKRASIFSILSVLILIFISPAGLIGGWTYSIDPRLPFILIIAAFIWSAVLMLLYIQQTGKSANMENTRKEG
ncbi:MFS transporter [Paenibacillus sp. WQ 127069]|uniref:MFS transporter n=1 Tax=Paenibacillus baimaensis TaxID=2982185 RepID=A0ABT2U7D1_9BACL|nr:MFS transporter [Paenibacillus sp. WQ 127069]MCU6790519.1 MFS transporter [Paenibacillus sp. WQ 127069]